MQAISLDFLGVPGSAAGNATADLISKHGFPKEKRLGAGIIDGRSVYGDQDGGAGNLASALLAQAPLRCQCMLPWLDRMHALLGMHCGSAWPAAPVPKWDG